MATFRDLRRYVTNDKWTPEPNLVRGRGREGDHRRYFKDLPDGTRLRTKVPHDEHAEIGDDLFRLILRDQLRVTEERFWDLVHDRAEAEPETQRVEPIPGWLVTRLLFTVGLSEEEIARMTPDEAHTAWVEYQMRGQT